MKLIGMLDSPYVRRVAVSLKILGIPFEHTSLSVFSDFEKIKSINPVVKAPTFITDDHIVLMDSSLILEYIEQLAGSNRTLIPTDLKTFAKSQQIIGVALAVCEKSVQVVYEQNLRPPEKQHQPWLERVYAQLSAALSLLEQEVQNAKPWLFGAKALQADITSAVAFSFACGKLPEQVNAKDYPALSNFSAHAEATEAFQAYSYPA